MNIISLTGGALALRTDTFKTLRARSDVFYRGLLIVVAVGLVSGIFAAGVDLTTRVLRPPSEEIVIRSALQGFENSYNGPPELRSTIESYMTEGVAMGFELSRLPPNGGAFFRPFVRLLNWLGESIAVPFGWGYIGSLLLGGLLVHLASRWLGGRAGISQMLGLGALAFTPQLLNPLSSLLRLAGNLANIGAFGPVESLIGLVVLVWGIVIYVKATAIAQDFSYGRAIGAILIALVIAAVLLVIIVAGFGAFAAALITSLVAAFR